MTGGHLVLEVVASLRYETPSLFLSVRTVPGLERSDPRGASTDNSMRVSRWASKELRTPWRVSIADSHEHAAGEVPHLISSRAVGRPTGVQWFASDLFSCTR